MVSPACSWSSQSASKSPCSPTISISLGLSNWPVAKTRTTFPSRSIALIRGIRPLPSPRSILQNKTGAAAGTPVTPAARREQQANLPGRTNQGVGPSIRRRPADEPSPTGKVRSRHAAIPQAARDRLRPDLPAGRSCSSSWCWNGSSGSRSGNGRCGCRGHRVPIVLRRPGRPGGRCSAPLFAGRGGHPGGEPGRPADPGAALELCGSGRGSTPRRGCSTCRPARRRRRACRPDGGSGGLWRPGALVLTKRRIWFLPAAWDVEPWSIARDDVERIEAEPPALARFLPVRNWPDLLRFTATDRGSCLLRRGRSRRGPGLVRADPISRYRPARPPRAPDLPMPSRPAPAPQGVFDA